VALGHLDPSKVAGSSTPILKGIRVIELATVVAAPAAAAMMADLGADVIKVETPKGDVWRQQAIGLTPNRQWGVFFENNNRGKRSIVLDIKNPDALEALKKLIGEADVFVTNVCHQL
jgi:crotonobetainyl-CoA:carnitine CoA-transferase CaiB-like acyl-CoA transferase